MSIVPKDTIHVIAQSIGISNLQDDVAAALAPDVEYRMREIMQVGCAFHVFSQFSTPLCPSMQPMSNSSKFSTG
jgi:transcription initiation factor TFIID subunit 6